MSFSPRFKREGGNMDLEKVHEDVLRGKILNIGLGTQMQIQLGGMEGPFKSSLVGMVRDKYLMIQLPMMTGILNKLFEGNRVTARYIYSGSVYGFHSTVLAFITKPSPLLFLAYPKIVEILDLRNSKRVDCFFPAHAKIHEEEYKGVILDISTGGCKFSIDTACNVRIPDMEIGESISLSFQLIGRPEPRTVLGKVRTTSRDQGRVVVGIQFDALDSEMANSIEALIESFWSAEGHFLSVE
jgi:c-di-GMP-binding flagellar brake protein YcgR